MHNKEHHGSKEDILQFDFDTIDLEKRGRKNSSMAQRRKMSRSMTREFESDPGDAMEE